MVQASYSKAARSGTLGRCKLGRERTMFPSQFVRGVNGTYETGSFINMAMCGLPALSVPPATAYFTRPPSANPNRHRHSHSLKCTHRHGYVQARSGPDRERPDADANLVLRLAWFGAEALGNLVAVFNSKSPQTALDRIDHSPQQSLTRENVVQAVKDDYEQAYFVTGNVSTEVYEEDCEFSDSAASFKSLKRFKNNCSNFGALLVKSDVKLTKAEEFNDKFVAYWRFSSVLKFPWRPILSSTGFTEYYFNPVSGKICRHVEYWDVPKMALLGQVFKPNPSFRR